MQSGTFGFGLRSDLSVAYKGLTEGAESSVLGAGQASCHNVINKNFTGWHLKSERWTTRPCSSIRRCGLQLYQLFCIRCTGNWRFVSNKSDKLYLNVV